MTYWTMDESDGLPIVTLCEPHALEATNIGSRAFGLGTFKTMQEAAVVFDALEAVFGQGRDLGARMTSNEIGPCDECEDQKQRGAA